MPKLEYSDMDEIEEQLSDVLGFAADEHFEGWEDYWTDHEAMLQSMMILIIKWRAKCREKFGA